MAGGERSPFVGAETKKRSEALASCFVSFSALAFPFFLPCFVDPTPKSGGVWKGVKKKKGTIRPKWNKCHKAADDDPSTMRMEWLRGEDSDNVGRREKNSEGRGG